MNDLKKLVLLSFCLLLSWYSGAQEHPSIMMTGKNVAAIRKGIQTYPLLKKSYASVKADADMALTETINVPLPADGGGGFTHEQHKKNYTHILNCGIAYQISGDKKYADYVKNILLKYAADYEQWPLHPKRKEGHQGGKIFWQSLNDFVWQVYTIQGYDLAYNAINATDRKTIESHLFMPMLKFFTIDCKETFDKIHNHGTWDIAAVGMTGYVLHKPEYVDMAIKGSNKDGKTGYLAQIDQLFSPDGYYTEGPYYQRYALLPFVIFAKAINNYEPKRQIFNYRNQLLAKAISTSLQLTYTDGTFFPINDAIKDKTYESAELIYGVDIAYSDIKAQPELLDIAKRQNEVVISDAGLKISADLAAGKARPFAYNPQWIGDGINGMDGGLGILRAGSNEDQQCVLFKAASQGMGHGHFDRLNILYYDHGVEIFPDYGAARFLNIETKKGGDYLPENKSWAKQTVAHNTLVVDETSNFKLDADLAQKSHPEKLFFKAEANLQSVSASENEAYPGVKMKRTTALLKVAGLAKPLLIDVFQALSEQPHQYDLPFWYKGQLVASSFKISANRNNLKALGSKYGYEHIWLNAESTVDAKGGSISILNNKRFYTTHFTTDSEIQVKQLSLGANDPDMNLVDSKAFMLSQKQAKNQVFFSITEAHGKVNPISETSVGASSSVSGLKILSANEQQINISFKVKDQVYQYQINYQDKNNFIKTN
ncbi:heparinase II/III family protein [Pedobacter nototheniae]|uniref:heparinase II/III domain-containing protein n=1 Tax=Pedobacter nototheniae TaxID=2488994 RepID=UPI00292E67A2|nr:heparinase II/III family protein [Pedobacter nototheniae]